MGDFEAFHPDLLGKLSRLARGILRDAGLAEDAVQDAVLAYLRKRPAGVKKEGWLTLAVVRAASEIRRDRARRGERHARAARSEVVEAETPGLEVFEVSKELQGAVERLDQAYRRVVIMHHWGGLSAREIAERQGLPENTVRTQLQRAHAKLWNDPQLRRLLGDDGRALQAFIALAAPRPWAVVLQLIPRSVRVASMLAVVVSMGVLLRATLPFPEAMPSLGLDPGRDSESVVGSPRGSELLPPPVAPPAGRTPDGRTAALSVRGIVSWPASLAPEAIALEVRGLTGRPPAGRVVAAVTCRSAPDGTFVASLPMTTGNGVWIQVVPAEPSAFWFVPEATFVAPGDPPPRDLPLQVYPADARISGRVRTSDGVPLSRSVVHAWEKEAGEVRATVPVAVDGEGRYRIDVPSCLAAIELGVVTGNVLGEVAVGKLAAGEARLQDIVLEAPRVVQGRIVGEDQAPLAGARVEDRSSPARSVGHSDEQGRFVLTVPGGSGNVLLHAELDGYASGTRVWSEGDEVLVLARGVELRGHARDRFGQGVEGALVSVRSSLGRVVETTTGPDGAFTLPHLPRAALDLELARPGRGLLRKELDLRDAANVLTRSFVLDDDRTIRGRVEDPSGRPIAGACVRTSPAPATGVRVGTGPDGRFELPGVPVTGARLHAERAGTTAVTIDAPDGVGEVVIVLSPTSELRGRALDAGTGLPIPAVRLTARACESGVKRTSSVQSPDGTWHLAWDDPPGTPVTLLLEADGYAGALLQCARTTAVGSPSTELIRLPRETEIVGIVRDPTGAPEPRARVKVVPTDPGVERLVKLPQARTDESGAFTLTGLPGGEFRVQALGLAWLPAWSEPLVVNGACTLPDLVLRPGSILKGRLLDHEGRPLAGEALELVQESVFPARTDAQGSFTIGPLDEGPATLRRVFQYSEPPPGGNPAARSVASPARQGSRSLRVEDLVRTLVIGPEGSGEIELRPRGNTRLTGKVVADGPFGPTAIHLRWIEPLRTGDPPPEIEQRGVVVEGDFFQLEALEPGRYRLEAESLGPGAILTGSTLVTLVESGTVELSPPLRLE